MSSHAGTNNRTTLGKAAHTSGGKALLTPIKSVTREKSISWSGDVTRMSPNDEKMTSRKPSTPRTSGATTKGLGNSSLPGSPKKKLSTPRTDAANSKGILSRERLSNGITDRAISISVTGDSDSEIEQEEKDSVFSPISDKPLISILKVPGRARSQSLPPNMILQQMSEGISALGANSKLAGLLKRESSDEGSVENLAPPPSYLFSPRRVSFSLPQDSSDDTGSGSSTPSYHLLPPLGHDRLSPSIINAEQGNHRKGSPYPYDHSSSESLDSDHRSLNCRPSSAPKELDIQRDPLPTGSSIFQRAMAEVSDSSDKNSESSDSESNTDRSRSKTQKQTRHNKQESRTNYLTPGYGTYSTSPRRWNTSGPSPGRLSNSSVSPRRGTPSTSVSPRRPSKSDSRDSRRT